jgi:exonuclease III
MRIIEWNCQGAFRLKNKEILELKPDILIVPECEREEKLGFGKLTPKPNDFLWYGDTGKKGIAIFSFSDYKLKLLKEFNPEFRYVVPIEISNETNSFLLFAVWAMDNKQNPLSRYIGQVWNAVNYYQAALANNTILIGDFNSNQIWDDKERVGNHTDVVNFLNNFKIESLYHKLQNEAHGKESLKTFYMYRNLEKSYHIDYVFASHEIIKNGYNLTFGNPTKWIDKSDHVPMILDIIDLNSKIEIQDNFIDFTKRHLSNIDHQTKVKFESEIKIIEELAEKLDLQLPTDEDKMILIDKIETIKKIDKLTRRLNKKGS